MITTPKNLRNAKRAAFYDMLKEAKKDMKTLGVIKPYFLIYEDSILEYSNPDNYGIFPLF